MPTRPWQRIQWQRPVAEAIEEMEVQPAKVLPGLANLKHDLAPPPVVGSLRAALRASGTPHIPGKTPIEEACLLLKAGAEVEHALLVQYLYAAWSLGDPAVAQKVVEIAIQEMCHLVTVQNLLLFAGDRPFLNRQDQDPDPALAPFPFTLRPLTKSVLEEFLLAEMPAIQDMTPEQRQVMQPVIDSHKNDPGGGVHPVGLIYARVFWLFQKDDQPTQPWPEAAAARLPNDGHIETFPGQATAANFQVDPVLDAAWHGSHNHGGIFEPVNSRETALKAIADIAAQGEGLASTPGAPSHFSAFLDIFQNTNLDQLGSLPRPTDPFVSDQSSTDPTREANRVTHKLAASLCSLFDARYQIMLASLRASLSRSRSGPDMGLRDKYAKWAFEEMLISIRALSTPIGRLPCKAGGTAAQLSAAPCFKLSSMELPADPTALDQLLASLHQSAAVLITAAQAQGPDAVTKLALQTMQQRDHTRFPNL